MESLSHASFPPELRSEEAKRAVDPALPLLRELRAAGHEAWLVGGGVRDLLLGRPVSDWDLATSATVEAMKAIWPAAIETGIRHGTLTILRSGRPYEVTTFRAEGPYSDGRHPDWVRPALTLEEDLSRRDFTVNALAFDPESGELRDPHGGLGDLRARTLRAVGDADARFREDGLRPLRGIRLAAVLEFAVEAETLAAMGRARDTVAGVSGERVRDEILKLMVAPRPSAGIELLRQTGLLEVVLPELLEGVGMEQNPRWHAYDVYEHTLRSLDAAPAGRPLVRLAALLHDIGKPRTREKKGEDVTFYRHERVGRDLTRDILARLRLSRSEQDRVAHLVDQHMFHYTPEWTDATVRRFLRRVGPDNLDDLFALREADDVAHGTGRDDGPSLAELRQRIEEIRARGEALGVEDLAVGGREIMSELGLPSGPEVGRILRHLLETVLEDPARNTREELLARAREFAGRLDDPGRST